MAYTRNVLIPGLTPLESEVLKKYVVDAAAVGSVGVDFHERKYIIQKAIRWNTLVGQLPIQSEVHSWDVTVGVSSDDQGSVDDLCDFCLEAIAQSPNIAYIKDRTRDYRDRVIDYCNAQNERKSA